MVEIKASKMMTISTYANEIYAIRFNGIGRVDVFNNTDGELSVSDSETGFTASGNTAACITLASGCGYNGYGYLSPASGNVIYIKTSAGGTVVITSNID